MKNRVGEPVGYKLLPGDNSFPFASPNAWWRKRATVRQPPRLGHALPPRRTLRRRRLPEPERAAATAWAAGPSRTGRSRTTDVVLWYTFGHTHIPRPEDYPVMPTAYIGFTLKPSGFFDANPANDVPPSAKKATGGSCCH